jgi:LysM repeat protein
MRRKLVIGAVLAILVLGMVGPALAQGGQTVYVVQPGDTLFSIARRFNVNLATLAAANGIVDPSRILAGQRLVIPTGAAATTTTTTTVTTTTTGQVHIVQPGENLFRISLRYGVSMAALAAANGISNPSLIYVGQRLVIPAGGTVTTTATTSAASSPAGASSVGAPAAAVPSSGTTTFYLNGRPVAAGRFPRPNDERNAAAFETKRESFRQLVVIAQNNLAAVQVSDIRYGPYWATMKINLRNIGVLPAIWGGKFQVGTRTPIGLVDPAPGQGRVPVPRASGMWGFNVHLVDGRTVTAFAGCRHVNDSGGVPAQKFDCGNTYRVNPASDLAPGSAANSELVVYFVNPWTAPDTNQGGTGQHILYMELFVYTTDGRQTGTLLRIDMP